MTSWLRGAFAVVGELSKAMERIMRFFLNVCVAVGLIAWCNPAFAQSKSRVVGKVTDATTGEPLVGANLVLQKTHLGAVTDVNGKYFILAVPVGTYRLQASMLGYARQVVSEVVVSADRVAEVNLKLEPGEISMDAVVVTAQKDDLHKEVSSTQIVLDDRQIVEAAGIREINYFLLKQPGISDENGFLSIRGGSADQTGTMVNGLTYVNAAVGNAETTVPLSAIEQVSILSGGYNAEYGNFRSGLVNVTTKSGSKDGYHGTFTYSRNAEQMKRFGPAINDPYAPLLAPYLNPEVAFVGTDSGWGSDPYRRQQGDSFDGWIQRAQAFNVGKPEDQQTTPLDLYLLYTWLFMAEPDYQGLEPWLNAHPEWGTITEEQKSLFASHARSETGSDYNFDGGFGGPIPFLEDIGATFYLSNNSTRQSYVIPVSLSAEYRYTTLGTIRLEPFERTSLTLNGLWKVQDGVSSARPAFGDRPDAEHDGGFMPIDNVRSVVRNTSNSEYRMYWFDPPFFPRLKQVTMMGGLTLNHVFSSSTFAELTLSYLTIQNNNPSHGDDRDTTKILTWFGPFPVDEMPYGKWQFAGNHRLAAYTYPSYDDAAGLGVFRFRGKEGDLYDDTRTDQARVKLDIASQLGEHHYVKGGVEYNRFDLYHNFWERWNRNSYNIYEFNYHRTPSQTGVYIQDQMTFPVMLATLGVRFDYWYGGGGTWPSGDPFAAGAFTPQPYGNDTLLVQYLQSGRSYIWDMWEAYDQEHPGFLQPVKNFFSISPRLGISFPITEKAKFYFNYGHFRSAPPYYSMYMVSYRYTKNGLYDMANPNLEPPRTISYELGAAYNFLGPYTLRVAGYYKDVTGEQGDVNYQNAAGTLDYDSWANNNYEDIEGVEISLAKQDDSWLTGVVNFDYRLKKSGYTGRQTITDSLINDPQAGLYSGAETQAVPQPDLNFTLTLRSPGGDGTDLWLDYILGGWRLTFYGEWRAGSYYTWNPLNKPHLTNNLQWPDYWMADVRLNKSFRVAGLRATLYVDVKNVFNFKVDQMSRLYAFDRLSGDDINYFASLRMPMYDSPEFDALRAAHPGLYLAGDDRLGELRSGAKPYINDPNLPYFLYGKPREVWAGVRFEF